MNLFTLCFVGLVGACGKMGCPRRVRQAHQPLVGEPAEPLSWWADSSVVNVLVAAVSTFLCEMGLGPLLFLSLFAALAALVGGTVGN